MYNSDYKGEGQVIYRENGP